MNAPIEFVVNGSAIRAQAEARTSLADFIRDQLQLTGTHISCEQGVCGACTVLIDGAPARACIVLAASCTGADIMTIEGLDQDAVTAKLRRAFHESHALQCGFCTPGMIMTARDIVLRAPNLPETAIRGELAGNLCRCTDYSGVVRAIASILREGSEERALTVSAGPVVDQE